jgi:hypothetical protein
MKATLTIPLVLSALGLLAGVVCASSQPLSIDRFTIAGGGGPSSGGSFSLNGTFGQPDSGLVSGCIYSLAGGFWGAFPTLPPTGSVIIKVWVVGGALHLRFPGIPGRIYYVERAHSVTGPWPDRLAAITMPIDGIVEFVDTTGLISPHSFYRTSTD